MPNAKFGRIGNYMVVLF